MRRGASWLPLGKPRSLGVERFAVGVSDMADLRLIEA